MIKDLLAHEFMNKSKENSYQSHLASETTKVSHSESLMLKSLISRAGDLVKNNERLKFALHSINFPESYD